jgi:NDP-sugar pyrophosphorylase family protein
MQAVVLAGGLGTRLRPITECIPKPMVEVGGEPFLTRIVGWLARHDYRRLLFLLGYRGEVVSDYFGDGSRFGVSIDYSCEVSPLGTGGALRNALEKLEDEFLLLYGDSYLPIDYRQAVAAFRTGTCRGLLVVYDNRMADTGVTNNVAVDSDGWVARYAKGQSGSDLQYVEAGVLCFRKEVFTDLSAGQASSLEQEIYPKLIAQRQLRAYATTQRFFDIGTPQRLKEFASTL